MTRDEHFDLICAMAKVFIEITIACLSVQTMGKVTPHAFRLDFGDPKVEQRCQTNTTKLEQLFGANLRYKTASSMGN